MAESADVDKTPTNESHHHCPICFSVYNELEHRPKLLPCEHTLCKTCLHSLGPQFDCPLCRREVSSISTAGHGAASLIQTDFRELQLLSTDTAVLDGAHDLGEHTEGVSDEQWITANRYSSTQSVVDLPESEKPVGKDDNIQYKPQSGASHSDTQLKATGSCTVPKLNDMFCTAMEETQKKVDVLSKEVALFTACKDQTLEDIDTCFDDIIHTINRRRHLLRNQVVSMHEELVEGVEDDVEKMTFTLLCFQSLKKHSDQLLAPLVAADIAHPSQLPSHELEDNATKVQLEIQELRENIQEVNTEKINPICFEIKDKSVRNDITRGVRSLGRIHSSKNSFPVTVKISDVESDQRCLVTQISLLDSEGEVVTMEESLLKHVAVSVSDSETAEIYEDVQVTCKDGGYLMVEVSLPNEDCQKTPTSLKLVVLLHDNVIGDIVTRLAETHLETQKLTS